MKKMSFLVGLGVGYLLGTRAGREQFERIKRASSLVWRSAPVQGVVHKADETVGELTRNQAVRLTDHMADVVKDRINSTGRPKPRVVLDDGE